MASHSKVLLLDERSNLWVFHSENENVPTDWNIVGTFTRGDTRYKFYSKRPVEMGTARAIVLAFHGGLLEQIQPEKYSWEA